MGFKFKGFWFRVLGFGVRVSGFGFRVGVPAFGFRALGLEVS